MQIVHLSVDQRNEWNTLAAQEPSFGLLQSWEWGEFKEKFGWIVFRIAVYEDGRIIAGAQMLIRPLPSKLFSFAYIPRGPIGNWLDKQIASQLLSELHRIARLHRAIYLKIEPPLLYDPNIDQTLQKYRFRPISYTNQPHTTIILDLLPSLDEILRKMRKRTKERIKSSASKGVSISNGGIEDLTSFFNLMKVTGKRGHFPSRTRAYYEHEWLTFASNKQNVLLMATYQNQLLAVHMTCRFGDKAAYIHGGSLTDDANLYPNYLLIWEAIKWAKEQGCHTYDLWGIPDEVGQAVFEGRPPPVSDRTDGLWGVYRFKSGFSKNIVYYLGGYDFVYHPSLYALITNKLLNSEMIDRVSAKWDSLTRARSAIDSGIGLEKKHGR